jgi:hypothetical protein
MTAATEPVQSNTERVRRAELIRNSRAICLSGVGGDTIDQREAKRETKADAWSRWFHARMDGVGTTDPVEVLPDAFARLEQISEDQIAAAIHKLKTTLMGALK